MNLEEVVKEWCSDANCDKALPSSYIIASSPFQFSHLESHLEWMVLPLNSPITFYLFNPLLPLHHFFFLNTYQTLWSLNSFLSSGPSVSCCDVTFLPNPANMESSSKHFWPWALILCLLNNILSAYLWLSVIHGFERAPEKRIIHGELDAWHTRDLQQPPGPPHHLSPYWACLANPSLSRQKQSQEFIILRLLSDSCSIWFAQWSSVLCLWHGFLVLSRFHQKM